MYGKKQEKRPNLSSSLIRMIAQICPDQTYQTSSLIRMMFDICAPFRSNAEWGCLGLTSTAPNLLTPSKRPSHHCHYHDHDHQHHDHDRQHQYHHHEQNSPNPNGILENSINSNFVNVFSSYYLLLKSFERVKIEKGNGFKCLIVQLSGTGIELAKF